MPKLFYLPLEQYKERYTWLMSSPGGWAEDNFRRFGVDFVRVDGPSVGDRIRTGSVLDAFGRSKYAMGQISSLLDMIAGGGVESGDVVYVEDFWHPGIESLFYVRHLTGIDFKIGCFIHAQSVDNSDFTFPMRGWMRGIEQGYSFGYDYVFTCSRILGQLCADAGYDKSKLRLSGLPFNSSRLMSQLREMGFEPLPKRPRTVVFSSRFDAEKNPHFFLDLVESCPDVSFRLVSPRTKLSNDPSAENRARALERNGKLRIVDTSDKLAYYSLLSESEVQFNCALQDWVSWTLLEACAFGCKPLYPDWKDFPDELFGKPHSLYSCHGWSPFRKDEALADAREKLYSLFELPCVDNSSVVEKHDSTWETQLREMGLI